MGTKFYVIIGCIVVGVGILTASFVYVIKNERQKAQLQLIEQANKITIETQKTTQKIQQNIVKNEVKQNEKLQAINKQTNKNMDINVDNFDLQQLKQELQKDLIGFNFVENEK